MENKGKWTCNTCGESKGVTNGFCPKDGPTQTTPVDETAKKLGGFYDAQAEPAKPVEADKSGDNSANAPIE